MHSNIVVLSDRIKELSHTKGQDPFVLDGELAGFSPFGDFYKYGDVVYYAATDGTYYEMGSGEYRQSGSDNELTRFPLRSSALDSGPYYLNGDSASGPTRGQQGYFHPLYLTKSAALAVAGATSAHTHTFSGYHGNTFYMPNNHAGHAEPSHAGLSGVDYVASGQPFNFPDFGIKEVYVTYPGKYSVFTGYGISGFKEPQNSGLAVWGSEQLLNYDDNILWSVSGARLGISQTDPKYAIDIGGIRSYSQVRASGFIDGGSGVLFSGGQALPQDATKTASGGTQLEPFFRNELDGTTGTNAVFFLSGVVDERFCFLPQEKGTIFSGPPSGCEAVGCSPDVPTFRYLQLEDIPDLSTRYVVQDKAMDEDPDTLTAGSVALYKESGIITYDDKFVFLKSSNRVGIGANDPIFSLDVRGGNIGVSGDIITSGDIYTAYGSNVHSSGGVFARTDSYFGNDVTISGDLFVKGTTTYNDSTNVTIQDKQLELASTSGNDSSSSVDHLVDDGGVVIRSSGDGAIDTGDKKWTWKSGSNTWAAATSNNEKLGITTSGLIFNDSSVVSGAYVGGSGLTLDDGRVFQIGNMFKVGAISSGYVNPTLAYTTHQIHQGTEVAFSGLRGLAVGISGIATTPSGGIIFDPSELSGILQYGIDNTTDYSFKVSDGTTNPPETISSADTVFISGASGCEVLYHSDVNLFAVTANGLSGYLDGRIGSAVDYANWVVGVGGGTDAIASTNTVNFSGVDHVTVGYNSSSNVMKFSASGLEAVVNASGAAVSGLANTAITAVSGFAFGHDKATSGILQVGVNLVSGYVNDKIGGLGGGYGHWKLSDGLTDFDNISSSEGVNISGISGITTQYTASSNHLIFSAGLASGNLQYEIDSSGAAVSGISKTAIAAVSGFAAGSIDTSALTFSDGLVRTADDVSPVSGAIGSGAMAIGRLAGHNALGGSHASIAVGSGAAQSSSGNIQSIFIGTNAGTSSSGNSYVVAVGSRAGAYINADSESSNFIGRDAGLQSSGCDNSNFIGIHAGRVASGCSNTNMIGNRAGLYGSGINNSNAMGRYAAAEVLGANHTNFIGDYAGSGAHGFASSNIIGREAGYQAVAQSGMGGSVPSSGIVNFIGHSAGAYSFKATQGNFIGALAGYSSSGNTDAVAIGTRSLKDSAWMGGSVNLGYEAGMGSSGIRGVNIGYGAGVSSSGWTTYQYTFDSSLVHSVAIGYYAGRSAVLDKHNIMLGYKAGESSHGMSENIAIGRESMQGYMGHQRGSLTQGNVFIGQTAGQQASGLNRCVGIGRQALQNASGMADTLDGSWNDVAIGYFAGKDSYNASNNQLLGYGAGAYSSGNKETSMLGHMAGYLLATTEKATVIGYKAGEEANRQHYSTYVGPYAGRHAQGKDSTSSYNRHIGIGMEAGSYSSGIARQISIGVEAGKQYNGRISSTVHSNNIMIGYQAGISGCGAYNTLIGYNAGGGQVLNRAIVLNNDTPTNNTSWVSTSPEDYVVAIGKGFFQHNTNAVTQIGKKPTTAAEFSAHLLKLANHSTDKTGLKTTMYSSYQVADQIQASTDEYDFANTIVNAEGFLQLPIALNTTGTGATRQLYTHSSSTIAKYEISRVEGTVCIVKSGSNYNLATYLNGQWRKMVDTFNAW